LRAIGAYGNLKTDTDGIEAIECIGRLIINFYTQNHRE
jgi:hypothetical protein